MKLNGLGKLTYKGKEYSNQDIVSLVSLNSLGYGGDFYGGNCKQFGLTKEGVYLCLDKDMKPFDILMPDEAEKTGDIVVPFSTEDKGEATTKYREENGKYICNGCGKEYNKKIAAVGHTRYCSSCN